MNYTVIVLDAAKRDLTDAFHYIKDNLDNEIAAKRLLDTADGVIDMLEFMPGINRIIDDDLLAEKGVRKMPIKKYLAFYVIYEDIKTVYVLRILHSSCSWLTIMRNEAVKL